LRTARAAYFSACSPAAGDDLRAPRLLTAWCCCDIRRAPSALFGRFGPFGALFGTFMVPA